jgi:hypothetical protein
MRRSLWHLPAAPIRHPLAGHQRTKSKGLIRCFCQYRSTTLLFVSIRQLLGESDQGVVFAVACHDSQPDNLARYQNALLLAMRNSKEHW